MKFTNKKGAIEMSVGTIVTIVLLVTVLILGLVLVRTIFSGGTDAVENINVAIDNEIVKLFSEDEEKGYIIYPPSRDITIKKGDSPKGFAISVRNLDDTRSHTFDYMVVPEDITRNVDCRQKGLTTSKATSYLIGGEGRFLLGAGETLENPRLVKLDVPSNAPTCSFFYNVNIQTLGGSSASTQAESIQVFVNIK